MNIGTAALAGLAALAVGGAASAADCASCTCKTKVVHRVAHRHPVVHRAVLAGGPPAVSMGVDRPQEVGRAEPVGWYGYGAPYGDYPYAPGPYYAYGYPYYGPWGLGGHWGYAGRWGYGGRGYGGFHHR